MSDPAKLPPLEGDDLDQMMQQQLTCPCCGLPYGPDNPLSLAPRCHVGAPVHCEYWGHTLVVTCAICDKLIAKIATA